MYLQLRSFQRGGEWSSDLLTTSHSSMSSTNGMQHRQIHDEACNTMVETNRFVRIESGQGIPINDGLRGLRIPIISTNRKVIDHFKGYTISIRMTVREPEGTSNAIRWPSESFMLLARDMERFCQALIEVDARSVGITKNLEMTITIGPHDRSSSPKPHTDKIQQSILQPFRKMLRGLKDVEIRGRVSPELADMAKNEILADLATSPEQVLQALIDGKETGVHHFRKREYADALNEWLQAASKVEKIQASRSWATLAAQGGPTYLQSLSETYFLTKLNILHIIVQQLDPTVKVLDLLAEDALCQAGKSTQKGFWSADYK